MSEIGLPENLWMGVAAVNDKAPEADVKVKMHDMAAYLGKQID